MPFHLRFDMGNASISFWRTKEREDEMLNILSPHHHYAEQVSQFRSPKRRREWLATRCLLHQLLGEEVEIAYLPSGKPRLLNHLSEQEISISHTKDWVAIALSPKGQFIGLDIEADAERAVRLEHRFIRPEEHCLLSTDLREVHLWCAKEAVYKLFDTPGVGFLEHICLYKDKGQYLAVLPMLQRKVVVECFTMEDCAAALAFVPTAK